MVDERKPVFTCGPTRTVITWPPPLVISVLTDSSKVMISTLLPNFGLVITGLMFALSQASVAASFWSSMHDEPPPGQSWASSCELGRMYTKLASDPAARSADRCENGTMFAACVADPVTSLK